MRPLIGAVICDRPSCRSVIASSLRACACDASATCTATCARQVILVGDAAGLQQAVGAIFLRPRVGAIGLGHVEVGLRAIARQPEVGVVQHSEQLAARDAIAFGLEHPFEARRNLRDDRDLATADRACRSASASRPDRASARLRCAPERCARFRLPVVSASRPAHAAAPSRGQSEESTR